MRWHRTLESILGAIFRRRRADAELEDEMRDHLEREIESNIRAGLPPEEARFAAQRLIGSTALHKEECRDVRRIPFIETLGRNLRYASRMLRRTPLFTAAAALTLALGIGANTTVFTFVENILLRSVPARAPEQLVSINWNRMINISYPNYVDFRDRSTAFSSIVASRFNPLSMSIHSRENFRVWGYEVSGNYFETLGIAPELGRFLTPADDPKPGANPVIVISDRYWRSHFASDARVIGRIVKLNGFPFTIVGVAPPAFLGTELIVAGDYWVPMSMETQIEPGNDWLRSRGSQEVWAMGRLKPGVTVAQAKSDLARIARQLARAYPSDVEPKPLFELPRPGLIGTYMRGPITAFGVAFMAIAGAVLLLSCINLAGMLLARASDRQREIGIRLAIGANRPLLVGQLMTESMLLASLGALFGWSLAFLACRLFSSLRMDFDLPVNNSLHPDAIVLLFTIVLTVLTTLFFGLVPAIQAVRADVIPTLKDEPLSSRFRRFSFRDLLVVGQIALSIILVIASVLVVRSLQHALTMNLGFNPEHAVAVSFDLRLQGYDGAGSRRFDAELLEKASVLPGLRSVAIVSNLPLRTGESDDVPTRGDRPMPPRAEWFSANIYNISPHYFETAGTRILLGRDITPQDREGTPPVVIVNEALIKLLYAHENPLGKRLRMGGLDHDYQFQIIGVVETGKYDSLGEDPLPVAFFPIAQSQTQMTTLLARTSLPARQATELLRKAVLDLNPELTIFNAGSLKDQLAMPLFPARAAAIVLGVFGVLAIVLAATGLFALVAYSVARRMREIGIRMALGARSGQVLSSVLRRTAVLCAAGILIGAAAALAAARLLAAILYGVSPRDPFTYATAPLLMICVAFAACWHPALRAIRVDPARTLREQ
jgi:predicted permease